MGEDNKLTLPTLNDLRALNNEQLIDRVNTIILDMENPTGTVHTLRGGVQVAIARIEYLTQELIRRDQAKQNTFMTGLTVAIGIMTLVNLFVTIWTVSYPH